MESPPKKSLLKALGLWDSMAIAIGVVIGVGIFRVPSEVAQYLPSAEFIILAWIIGGVISIMGCSCYGELSSLFPLSGGEYVFLRESYNSFIAFLYGWAKIVVVRPGINAAIAFIFSEYWVSLFSMPASFVKPIAIAIILILSVLNMLGIKKGKELQNISVIAKIAILLALIVIGIFSGKGDPSNFVPQLLPAGSNLLVLMGLALIPVLWTYGGWHENTFVGDETVDGAKTLPKAMMRAVLIITFLYILMNAVYIYLLPVEKLISAKLVISDAMKVLFGAGARRFVEILVIISALSVLNGTIITSSRLTYAVGIDSPILSRLGDVHPSYRTPAISLTVNAILSVLFILLGTFNKLLFFTGILIWLFFGMTVLGVFILRRKYPDRVRQYKVRGYPFTPIIFALISFGLTINILIFFPLQSAIGILLALTGAPVYWLSKRLKKMTPEL